MSCPDGPTGTTRAHELKRVLHFTEVMSVPLTGLAPSNWPPWDHEDPQLGEDPVIPTPAKITVKD